MIVALLLLAHAAHATPTCNFLMFGSCETLASQPVNLSGSKKLGLPGGPTMIYNSLAAAYSPKNLPPPKETAEQKARTADLGKQAIAAAKAVITGGLDPALWTAEQRAMVARLDAVEVKTPKNSDPDCKVGKQYEQGAPEASYNEHNHSLVICPSAANLSPGALLLILTHEIGHSISPCVMAKDRYLLHSEHFASCKLDKDEREFLAESLKSSGIFLPRGEALDPDVAGLIKKMTACHALEAQPQANFHGKPEVYEKLSQCLDQRYSGNWKMQAKREHFDEFDLAPGGDGSQRCISIYDEHFADAFGARAFGQILKESPDAATLARVAMVGSAADVCLSKGEKKPGDYPPDSVRFLLHSSAPATQKALGCKPEESKICGSQDFLTYPHAAAPESAPANNSAE